MDKGLEALERIKTKIIIETEIKVNRDLTIANPYYNDYLIIKKALLKAQEQENAGVGGRTFNKELSYLKQSIEQYTDTPIFYISRNYGNKYIVPQKQFDDLTNENVELKKVLGIIKPYLRLVDNFLQARVNFYDDYWLIVKEITDEEELKVLKKILGQTQI